MNAAAELLAPAALARHGGRVALACGGESITYAALAEQVARAAAALASLGVRRGERVLFLMRDTPEFAAAWLGAVHAGAVAVALNTKLGEDDFRHIAADSDARLAIVEDVFAAARPDLAAEYARAGLLAVAGASLPPGAHDWRRLVARAAPAPPQPARAEDPAFWLYSSGTTGKPKGIAHSHRAILVSGEALKSLGVQPGERVFATSKLFFAYGLEHGLLGPLALGATGVLLADWADPETASEAAARHRPVAMFSVPSFYRRLLAEGAARLAPFRRIRHFVAAGERLPQAVIDAWREQVGGEILSLYGTSEAYCACLMMPPSTRAEDNRGGRTGKPLPLTELRLADAAGAEPMQGEPGLLWLRHPALASGYVNRPELTRAQFRDGWFCTQDLFVRDAEGYYLHQGRADELVKIAGQWVRPAEIEEAVGADAAIVEAACVSVTDADGFERLALFVVPRGDEPQALAAAERVCAERLPRYKRPKWIRAASELPRTATGKLQRYRLREMLLRELGDGR
ncbi:MAG: AMP-binding protein [Burkholderiales bacterium]|nr:AMP-binding protein [Burkholderiales bacterium]